MKLKHLKSIFFLSSLFIGVTVSAQKIESQPNFLFIIADDIGKEMIGAYGNTYVNTPNIDALAKEGILFTNAFTTNGKCAPSRASVLTGRAFYQLESAAVHGDLLPNKFKSYPHILQENGYFVGYTGKGWAPGSWKKSGWAYPPSGKPYNSQLFAPDFSPRVGFRDEKVEEEAYKDVKVRAQGAYSSEQMKELIFTGNVWNTDYSANFIQFLDERSDEKPFCFWYGSHDAHAPCLKGSGRRFKGNLDEVQVPPFYPDTESVREMLLDIGVEVELYDAQVGEAIEALKDRGLYENTIIIVTSDNGTAGYRSKGDTYPRSVRMPFVVISPYLDKPLVCDSRISFSDIAPTILKLANLSPPSTMTGQSFESILTAGVDDRERSPMVIGKENYNHIFIYPSRSITYNNYHYTHNYAANEYYPSGKKEAPSSGKTPSVKKMKESGLLGAILLKRAEGDDTYWKWCCEKRPKEELYDLSTDPFCLVNLAEKPEHSEILEQAAKALEGHLKKNNDPRITQDTQWVDYWSK